MAIVEFLLITGGMGWLVFLIGKMINDRKQKERLDGAFYQLVESQNSEISLIQLAAAARVDAKVAQNYLERQVQIFSAMLEVDEDGETFYRFPKLRLPPKLLNQGW
jgi:hypothetical protein